MPKNSSARTGNRLSGKKPQRIERWVCQDPELVGRVEELEEKVLRLSGRTSEADQDELRITEFELAEARAAARAESIKFVAVAMGQKPFERLLGEYPPTAEQERKHRKETKGLGGLSFDLDLFLPELMKRCLRIAELDHAGQEVGLTELSDEEFEELLDEDNPNWNQGEVGELQNICLFVNQKVSRVKDLGNG